MRKVIWPLVLALSLLLSGCVTAPPNATYFNRGDITLNGVHADDWTLAAFEELLGEPAEVADVENAESVQYGLYGIDDVLITRQSDTTLVMFATGNPQYEFSRGVRTGMSEEEFLTLCLPMAVQTGRQKGLEGSFAGADIAYALADGVFCQKAPDLGDGITTYGFFVPVEPYDMREVVPAGVDASRMYYALQLSCEYGYVTRIAIGKTYLNN